MKQIFVSFVHFVVEKTACVAPILRKTALFAVIFSNFPPNRDDNMDI